MKVFTTLLFFLFASVMVGNSQPLMDSSVAWRSLDRQAYVIRYPENWDIDTSKLLIGADLFMFSKKESDTDKFCENVNIMIQDLKGFDFDMDKYVILSEAQIKTMVAKSTLLESKRLTKDGRECQLMIFSGVQGVGMVKVAQYYFLVKETAFVITFVAQEDKFDTYLPIGMGILNSFHLK